MLGMQAIFEDQGSFLSDIKFFWRLPQEMFAVAMLSEQT